VPAHVKVKTLVIFGARKTADLVSFLENQWQVIKLGQLIGCGQARRSSPDNDYPLFYWFFQSHEMIFPRKMSSGFVKAKTAVKI
jgi:hypothetical protein